MTRQRTRRLLGAFAAAAVVLLAVAGAWHAATPPRTVSLHERAVAVERTLRCPTCQGLSVADSPSPIAAGMRQQVERRLAAGASSAQIRGYFTARYSDWILLDPPRRGVGWLVWALPPLLLLLGGLLLRRTLRRRPSNPGSTTVDPADLAAAAAFAADPPIAADLPEPVAAALTDLHAARIDADLDPAGQGGVHDALARLAGALYDHPVTTAPTQPAAPDAGKNTAVDDAQRLGSAPRRGRGRAARYALPVAALLFAGLLGATLARTIGTRPAGAVPTGNFATAPPTPSGPGLAVLQHATQAHPTDPRAWLAYATALDQAGRLAAAEPNYYKTLALDTGGAAAREQLAWLLTRGGSPTDALTVLAPLTRQRPDDPQVVLLLGLAQRGAGQPQATATLRRYLHLAPGSTPAPMVRALLGQAP